MSYPYPFPKDVHCHVLSHECDDTCVWGSYAVTEPKVGEDIRAPDGLYKVTSVERGTHCSTGLIMMHGNDVSSEGWFWYGYRMTFGGGREI